MQNPAPLIQFYKDRQEQISTLPADLPYKKGEVITNPRTFIEAQIKALENPNNKRYHHLAYSRLNELAGYLIKHHNIKAP